MAKERKVSSETSEEVKVENVGIEQPVDANEELSMEPQNAEGQEVINENNAESVNDKAEGTEEEVKEPQEETKESETPQSEEPVEEPKVGEPETPKENIKEIIAQELLKRKNGAVKSKRSKSFEEAVRLRLKQGHKITFNEVKASRLAGKLSEVSQEREFRTRSLRRN